MPEFLNLSKDSKQAIRIAQQIAKEYHNEFYAPAHLLKALMHEDIGLNEVLEDLNKDINYLKEWADVRIEGLPKTYSVIDDIKGDDKIKPLFEEADLIRIKLSMDLVEPVCILIALCKTNIAFTEEQLKSFIITPNEIIEHILSETSIVESISGDKPSGGDSGRTSSAKKALLKFCIDKISLAKEGKIDPIIGRDAETRIMLEILARRTKPNVLIVGEPGVGKTALIDGLSLDIFNKKVPEDLIGASLFEIDLGSLAAGASYKGEMEDRMKKIINEVKGIDKAILFIDEIHTLFDSSGSFGTGIINLLKPELTKGELVVIGATTNEEYREFIESDEAFNRRFELLRIEEPDTNTTYRMLKHIIPLYVEHHQIGIVDDSIKEAISLAKRYLKERKLPDSAIDLIDRTMASVKIMDEISETEINQLNTDFDTLVKDNAEISFEDLKWVENQINSRISPLLLNQIKNSNENLETSDQMINYLNVLFDNLKPLLDHKKETIDKSDITTIVSIKTGIPIGKLQTSERDKLLNIEDYLKSRVIGQDHAIKILSDSILESRAGLTKHGQPIGSFFFLGPTGTGKTELSKSLAEFLFNDESALIRFDMSEFKEEHSAALLYGAPPGYVGYKEGGLLVNKIREKPYAVILFDEIEKAHASVFDIFLQIMDEGKLHDRLGKEGDFTNAIILFTSNIASNVIIDKFNQSGLPSGEELLEIMSQYFRPEYLARLTEIIPFAPITEENISRIFDIHLQKFIAVLNQKGIAFDLSKEALENLAMSGYSPAYGARPINGVIRNYLRRPISKMIISGELKSGDHIKLEMKKNKEYAWKTIDHK